MRRTKARHFGDNPKIRKSYREGKRINMAQPWERRYAGIKKARCRVSGHMRQVPGSSRRVKVRGHIRKLK